MIQKIKIKQNPHNPGLSEKAWEELHRKVVRWNIKYGDKLRENVIEGRSD